MEGYSIHNKEGTKTSINQTTERMHSSWVKAVAAGGGAGCAERGVKKNKRKEQRRGTSIGWS